MSKPNIKSKEHNNYLNINKYLHINPEKANINASKDKNNFSVYKNVFSSNLLNGEFSRVEDNQNNINTIGTQPILIYKKIKTKNTKKKKPIVNITNNYIIDTNKKKPINSPIFNKITTRKLKQKKSPLIKKPETQRVKTCPQKTTILQTERRPRKFNTKYQKNIKINNAIENTNKEKKQPIINKEEILNKLMKSFIQNVEKEFDFYKKKLSNKQILTERKKEYLKENGIITENQDFSPSKQKNKRKNGAEVTVNGGDVINSEETETIQMKKIKEHSRKSIKKLLSKNIIKNLSSLDRPNNLSISNINNIINSVENSKYYQLKQKNDNSKSKSIKPQINQFEYLNKIKLEHQKIIKYKITENNFSKELNNLTNNSINDSFRHKSKKKEEITIKVENDDEENEIFPEFPFADKKSRRTKNEIEKFMRKQKMENKNGEEIKIMEKKNKLLLKYNNLKKLEEKYYYHKEKNNIKKEENEFFIGSSSIKNENDSTLIDQKEYYINLLESKLFLSDDKLVVNNIFNKFKKENTIKNKLISFINVIKKSIRKNILHFFQKINNSIEINRRISYGFKLIVFTCKNYQYHKIINFSSNNKKITAIKTLNKLFFQIIKNDFAYFIKNCSKINHTIDKFINIVTKNIKYKTFKKIKIYSTLKKFVQLIRNEIFLKNIFEKIKISNKNEVKEINEHRSYFSTHLNDDSYDLNSYLYESFDCDDSFEIHPNSVDNDNLHQLKEILDLNNLNQENNLLNFAKNYNTYKNNCNINNNKKNNDNNKINNNGENFDVIYNDLLNQYNNKNNNNTNEENFDIYNDHLNQKNNENENNNNINTTEEIYKILEKNNNIEKNGIANELTEYILKELIIKNEISPYKSILPNKSNKFNKKYYSSTTNSLVNNSQDYNFNNSNTLENSLISQYSFMSEFNKSLKEIKNNKTNNLYRDVISKELVKFIMKELKKLYPKIYDNISTPKKTDNFGLQVALLTQDNQLFSESCRKLNVKENLFNIINKKNILEKFLPINKKIRIENNSLENLDIDTMNNGVIVDCITELINNERYYGKLGEPLPFSFRSRENAFKYKKDDPKYFLQQIFRKINDILYKKENIIDENSPIFDKYPIFLMRIFKKELEENLYDLEIHEERIKLDVGEIIMDQLFSEVIEILEHVNLNRKNPELYQYKSIFACYNIPKLSFQMNNYNNIDDEFKGFDGNELINI